MDLEGSGSDLTDEVSRHLLDEENKFRPGTEQSTSRIRVKRQPVRWGGVSPMIMWRYVHGLDDLAACDWDLRHWVYTSPWIHSFRDITTVSRVDEWYTHHSAQRRASKSGYTFIRVWDAGDAVRQHCEEVFIISGKPPQIKTFNNHE
jgi:hypothetical protein